LQAKVEVFIVPALAEKVASGAAANKDAIFYPPFAWLGGVGLPPREILAVEEFHPAVLVRAFGPSRLDKAELDSPPIAAPQEQFSRDRSQNVLSFVLETPLFLDHLEFIFARRQIHRVLAKYVEDGHSAHPLAKGHHLGVEHDHTVCRDIELQRPP